MDRFIVVSVQACVVFFDNNANTPLEAIIAGEAELFNETVHFESCQESEINAVFSVYRALPGFQEVGAYDYGIVTEQCEFVECFRQSAEETEAV